MFQHQTSNSVRYSDENFLLPPPSPYEYALLSKASYLETLQPLFQPTIHCIHPPQTLEDNVLYLYLKNGILKCKGKTPKITYLKADVVKAELTEEKFNTIKEKLIRNKGEALTLEESVLVMHELLTKGYPQASVYILRNKEWECAESIQDEIGGYRGSLWVHRQKKQIVIVHRGSKNLDSWITDAESIRQLKPGHFVEQAVRLLSHEIVQQYKAEGYRLSVTGHSLGGFLAQVSVYWAQRSEFLSTYYPNISAIVFDSPGAADFLHELSSNLLRERRRVIIEHLNIQNFCAMPTLVSTYGVHTGTIWQLASDLSQITFDIANAHRMEPILAGFNPETDQPYVFRLMHDWPLADYSHYDSLSKMTEHLVESTVMLPFDCFNKLYKTIGKPLGYERKRTWYEQLLSEREGQFNAYLQETVGNRFPSLEDFNSILTLAIQGHYIALTDASTEKRIDIHHFDQAIQNFLIALSQKSWSEDLSATLRTQYYEGFELLTSFRIIQEGDVTEVHLHNYPRSQFDFQNDLYKLIHEKQLFSTSEIMLGKLKSYSYFQEQNYITQELELYVPPFSCDPEGSPDVSSQETLPFLQYTTIEFLKSEQKVLLIKGESGSGKTLLGRYLEKENYLGRLDLPPEALIIYIYLPSLKNPISNLINEYFERVFKAESIRIIEQLMKRKYVYFILDAYDEIEQFQQDTIEVKNLYSENRLHEWEEAKFIFSCRTSFLNRISENFTDSYKTRFAPPGLDSPQYNLLKVIQIALFNQDQVDIYIDKFADLPSQHPDARAIENNWTADVYKEKIKSLPGVKRLIGSPLLLKMTVEALPTIVAWHEARKLSSAARVLKITERDIYLAYLKHNIIRQENRLTKNGRKMPNDLKTTFLKFLVDLCYLLARNANTKSKKVAYNFRPLEHDTKKMNDGPEWATAFFGDPTFGRNQKYLQYLEMIRNNLTCFLKYENGEWSFVHESFFGKIHSINTIEILEIQSERESVMDSEKAREEGVKEFSRALFKEPAGHYYFTMSERIVNEDNNAEALDTSLREEIFIAPDKIAIKLRQTSANEKIVADIDYEILVKQAIKLKVHLMQSSNNNTALHWALIKKQSEKVIILLREIKKLGSEAHEALEIEGDKEDTVLTCYFKYKKEYSEENKRHIESLFEEIKNIALQPSEKLVI